MQLLARSGLAPGQAEWVDAIRASGSTLLGILDDVLDFSKIEAGQLTLESAPFDRPTEGAGRPASDAGDDERTEREKLRLEIDPGLPGGVLGDRRALHQIVLNLAGNAVKFTARGFVAVRAQCLPRAGAAAWAWRSRTAASASPRRRSAASSPNSPRPTVRSPAASAAPAQLAICRRLVDLQGGSLGVRSRPGEGQHLLPANWNTPSQTPGATGIAASARCHRRGARLHVLVVEDVELNRCIAGTLLEDEATPQLRGRRYGALELHEREDFDTHSCSTSTFLTSTAWRSHRRIRRHPDARKAARASSRSPLRSPPTRWALPRGRRGRGRRQAPSTSTSCCAASTRAPCPTGPAPRRRDALTDTRRLLAPASPASAATALRPMIRYAR